MNNQNFSPAGAPQDLYGAGPGQPPGYPQGYPQGFGQPPVKQGNGLATAGFVLGLLGFLTCWIPVLNFVGILLGILGVVLAIIGLVKSSKTHSGKGLAIAGIVLGALAVILAFAINALFVGAVDYAIKEGTTTEVISPDGEQGDSKDASALGTERSNPAPLGSEVKGGDWTVKVTAVDTVGSDNIGQTAAAGSVLLKVSMSATYTGDDAQGESSWATVKFVTQAGKTIGSTDGSTMFIAENEFNTLEKTYAGGSVTGDQILEVPAKGWKKGVLAVSPGMFNDDTFIAVN